MLRYGLTYLLNVYLCFRIHVQYMQKVGFLIAWIIMRGIKNEPPHKKT